MGAVQSIDSVYKTESGYHSLGLEVVFARPKEVLIQYGVNSSTPCQSNMVGLISPSTVHIVSDQFRDQAENRSDMG